MRGGGDRDSLHGTCGQAICFNSYPGKLIEVSAFAGITKPVFLSLWLAQFMLVGYRPGRGLFLRRLGPVA